MKKNGFTLIELLAVIVILAIIALIATPIILGIINDAREKANERSVELYASAVKNGIAAYQLLEGKGVAAGTYTKETLPFDVEYDGEVECTSIVLSEDSKVSLSGCKVNDGEKTYNYGIEESSSLAGTMGICNPLKIQTPGAYTAGDKYECDVDPNKDGYDQIFYILNSTSTEVNLIMDSNITRSGEAIKDVNPIDKGLIVWVSKTDYTREDVGGTESEWRTDGNWNKGPITAIEYLRDATKDWTNVNQQTLNTFDAHDFDGNYIGTYDIAKTYTLNARMPYFNEISSYSASAKNAYLYDYLETLCHDEYYDNRVSCDEAVNITGVHEKGMTHISDVYSYWTLSADLDSMIVKYVSSEMGGVSHQPVINNAGIRPVINLSI